MRRTTPWLMLALMPTVARADSTATSREAPVEFTPAQRNRILQHSPLPAPSDPTNRFAADPRAATLGQFLFFDKRLSIDGARSCASCHDPARGFTDAKPVAEGRQAGTRNTLSLWNTAYQRWYFWDGRADSLWAQALGPMEGDHELGNNRMRLARWFSENADLRAAYEAIFGPLPDVADRARFPSDACPMPDASEHPLDRAWCGMRPDDRAAIDRVVANIGKALAAYEMRLVSRRSAFDVFVEGLRENAPSKRSALSPGAQRGLQLFVGSANCRLCHSGPTFSDGEFHDIRIPGRNRAADPGRFKGAQFVRANPFNVASSFSDDRSPRIIEKIQFLAPKASETWGTFRTPTLRNVARTAPYMDQGQFASITDVLRYYSTLKDAMPPGHHKAETFLVPLNLTDQQIADLVAFLESLTDESIDPTLLRAPASALSAGKAAPPSK